jgi:hypothetical protein
MAVDTETLFVANRERLFRYFLPAAWRVLPGGGPQ